MAAKSLYTVLGVSKTADAKSIKKSYRTLARKHHPDKNPGDASAEARFKEIGAAFEVLGDKKKRALYDEFGDESTQLGFDAEKAREYKRWQQQGQSQRGRAPMGGGFSQEDLLRELFGGGGPRGYQQPRKGADLQAELTVDFRSAALGGERTLTFHDGRNLKVRIPPGVSDGGTIRLRGQGQPGPAGSPAGDLLITLQVLDDAHFKRDGLDLHLDLPVTVLEAVEGAKIRVPTLAKPVELKVPAGSQTGRTMRLRGKGITRRGKPPGDLYVHLEVHVPTTTSQAVTDALKTLESAYTTHPRGALQAA